MSEYNADESPELIAQREAYAKRIRAENLKEGWSYDKEAFQSRPYWPTVPKNDTAFYLWSHEAIADIIEEAKSVVRVGRGTGAYDRRVISLCNPGLGGKYAATATLFADIQLLGPGESAPSHRHTPCATRFIMNGDGGWTNVAGDKVPLKPGDIVYCGPNFWHDHKNEGSTDMVFLDVLDIPLLQYLGVSEWYFNAAEVSGSKDEIHHPVTHSPDFDNSHKSRIQPTARPRFEAEQRKYNEVQHFSFEDTKTLFDSLMNEDGSPFDDLIIQFQNPHTHNPVGPTVDICSQMIRPGVSTSTHRHTWATICMVAEGQGDIVVDGKTVPFKPNDIFVIPGWAWHHWKNSHDTPCIVHSISDYALLERIGFAREQSEEADTGWQPIPFTRITRD